MCIVSPLLLLTDIKYKELVDLTLAVFLLLARTLYSRLNHSSHSLDVCRLMQLCCSNIGTEFTCVLGG